MKYYKVVRKTLLSRGLQLQEGLNVDTRPIEPLLACGQGIHFSEVKDIFCYVGKGHGNYICEVIIPEDAIVVRGLRKLKADQLIIETPTKITPTILGKLCDEGANIIDLIPTYEYIMSFRLLNNSRSETVSKNHGEVVIRYLSEVAKSDKNIYEMLLPYVGLKYGNQMLDRYLHYFDPSLHNSLFFTYAAISNNIPVCRTLLAKRLVDPTSEALKFCKKWKMKGMLNLFSEYGL